MRKCFLMGLSEHVIASQIKNKVSHFWIVGFVLSSYDCLVIIRNSKAVRIIQIIKGVIA